MRGCACVCVCVCMQEREGVERKECDNKGGRRKVKRKEEETGIKSMRGMQNTKILAMISV